MNENELIHGVREAAEHEDAESAMQLAECYMKGEGAEKNGERSADVVPQGGGAGI